MILLRRIDVWPYHVSYPQYTSIPLRSMPYVHIRIRLGKLCQMFNTQVTDFALCEHVHRRWLLCKHNAIFYAHVHALLTAIVAIISHTCNFRQIFSCKMCIRDSQYAEHSQAHKQLFIPFRHLGRHGVTSSSPFSGGVRYPFTDAFHLSLIHI